MLRTCELLVRASARLIHKKLFSISLQISDYVTYVKVAYMNRMITLRMANVVGQFHYKTPSFVTYGSMICSFHVSHEN